MKKEVINIRVSSEFKSDLETLCEIKGIKVSEFGRIALTEYFNSRKDESYEKLNNQELKRNDNHDDLLQSLAFTEFIFWIYEKKFSPYVYEIESYYLQHIALIDEMQTHPRFTKKILHEFGKIKDEFMKRLEGYDWGPDMFKFAIEGHSSSFDYECLRDFMYNIRYTEDQEQDLFIK